LLPAKVEETGYFMEFSHFRHISHQHLVVEQMFAAIGGIKKAHPTQCRMRFLSNLEFL